MTVEHYVALADRFVNSVPLHASPMEHQATLTWGYVGGEPAATGWKQPNLAGNLAPGWVQYRKLILGEAVAPLPERYR